MLSAARDIASYNRPPTRDYMSVKSYFDEEDPLCNNESYIYRKEDIISLKPGRENAWLDAFVEKVLQKLSCRVIRVGNEFLKCEVKFTNKSLKSTYSVLQSVTVLLLWCILMTKSRTFGRKLTPKKRELYCIVDTRSTSSCPCLS
jgi:hypothetical protein